MTDRFVTAGYSATNLRAYKRFERALLAGWRCDCPVFPAVNLAVMETEAASKKATDARARVREASERVLFNRAWDVEADDT